MDALVEAGQYLVRLLPIAPCYGAALRSRAVCRARHQVKPTDEKPGAVSGTGFCNSFNSAGR